MKPLAKVLFYPRYRIEKDLKMKIFTKETLETIENMRAKEAHKYLGVGLSTLWSFVAQKRIKAYKISDRVTIFKKSELDAFINGGAK